MMVAGMESKRWESVFDGDLGLGLWIWRCGWASGLMTTMGRNSNTKMEVETIVRIAEGMRLNEGGDRG